MPSPGTAVGRPGRAVVSGIEPWRAALADHLISWSRMLGGATRSAGREGHLIGVGFGVAIGIVVLSRDVVGAISGQPPGPMFNGVALLTSPRWVVAGVLGSAANSLMNGVILSLLYVVLRQLLRASLPAAILSTVILALLISSDDWRSDSWHGFAIAMGMAALLLLPLLRFGLLPFTVSWWTNSILYSNVLTSDLGGWYAPPTWIGGGLATLARRLRPVARGGRVRQKSSTLTRPRPCLPGLAAGRQ